MQRKPLTKLFSNSRQALPQLQGLALNIQTLVVDPDIMFLSRPNFSSLMPRSSSLVRSDIHKLAPFSTLAKRQQMNTENLSVKLERQDIFSQSPAKFFTCRAEEETVQVEGVGWAGQPIVKRLHTILPEVHGSDILKLAKKSKTISEVGSNLDVKVRNFGRSHDIIAIINKRARNEMGYKNPEVKEVRNRILHAKKEKQYLQNSGILLSKPLKIKRKKRTVVLASKSGLVKNPTKRKLHKKKKFSFNKGFRIKPTTVIGRRLSTMSLSTSFVCVTNRQFQSYSALNSSKAAVTGQAKKGQAKKGQAKKGQAKKGQAKKGQAKTGQAEKGQAEKGQAKKGKPSKTPSLLIIPDDDCVCPEILYTTGKKKSTKICGQAAGVGKDKKKSSWKQKMCLVGAKDDPGRKKTFVCISEAQKLGKRKKELPKCPKPEKLDIPRVIICEPNLIDEAEKLKKKECVKVEEEKIRKKTKVCKPVIIFAKEEIGVKAEKKAVCSSTRIKKVVSRHTKICPP